MKRFADAIKIIAADIGGLKEFRKQGGGLPDFLANRLQTGDTAACVAARLLEYFCLDDNRRFNNFMPGVQLTISFLNYTTGPDASIQSIKDLRAILEATPTTNQLKQWAEANYPE
ncbi:MAG: hypothetical protein V3R99_03905 [Thermoguttaceae bacterium]